MDRLRPVILGSQPYIRAVQAAGEIQDRAASERMAVTDADLQRTRQWANRNGAPPEPPEAA